jgi:choice-of-anchor B domain-containing protein
MPATLLPAAPTFRHAATLALLLACAAPLCAQGRNCRLQSQLARAGSTGYAGVWGYFDPLTLREFAVVGSREGTWVVETTNPTSPVERGFIPGPSSVWRELSSFRHFVYAVTEAQGGVQIISMANPAAPVLVRNFTVSGWNNTHAVQVDQTAGRLYCHGTSGGMRVFDLNADPTNPVPVGIYTSAYVHDAFIQHGLAYLACIFDGQMRIVDVSNLPTFAPLSTTVTPNAFTHNVWVDSADAIAVTTDETSTGFLQVYDVTNKRAPVARGSFSVPGAGIHNAFIREDKVAHCSWYQGGYHAVDITDPSNPREVGSYPTANAWGCYPFQPSGNVYVSDIPGNGGLYVVKLTCGVPDRYGRGTAGSGSATPVADWHGGFARVANPTFRVTGKSMLGGTAALLLIGAAPAALSAGGITVLVQPTPPLFVAATTTTGSGAGQGTASLPLAIPNDPALGGASLYAQWVVVDAGGPQGLSASDGLGITVCR